MASSMQFHGWELSIDGRETDSSRLTRKSVLRTSPVLRRELDGLEVKEGDFILYGSNNQPQISMVKDITLDLDKLTIMAFNMLRRSSIPKEDIPDSQIDDLKFETNEVYLTPEMMSVDLNDILQTCRVLNQDCFQKIVLDESNMDSTFICRRFSDSIGNYFTDIIDFNEFVSMFIENKSESINHLRKATVASVTTTRKSGRKRNVDESSNMVDHSPRKNVINKVKMQILGDDDEDLEDTYSYSSSDYNSASDSSGSELEDIIDDELYEAPTKRRKKSPNKINSKVKKEKLPQLPTVSRRLDVSTDQNREGESTQEVLIKAKKILGTGAEVQSLPCREAQFHKLYHEIHSSVTSQQGKFIYVSGTPGVGKTATIREVIKQLSAKLQVENNGKVLFNYVEINGLKLVSPQSSYEALWKKISGKKASANTALTYLQSHFESNENSSERLPLVVLLDELDQILTKNQTVIYNFSNWPTIETSKLIVIAVANTMDLPERLVSNKIASRLGLNRVSFPTYTYDELAKIIRHRLENLSKSNNKLIIANDAIEFASRKVASVSGDARRSLMICIRAVEIAEMEYLNKSKKERKQLDGKYTVTIMHIMKAVNETASSPITNYLYSLPFMSKMVLATLLISKKRLGVAEIPIGHMIDELNVQFEVLLFGSLKGKLKEEDMDFIETMYGSSINGPTTKFRVNGFSYILNEFEEAGILAMQQVKTERSRLLRLNVSDDEILTCFKKDPLIEELVSKYGGYISSTSTNGNSNNN